jgi:hypothetical protein
VTDLATEQKASKNLRIHRNGSWFYCLGVLGAWFYYFTTAPGFLDGVLGFFKGILWPAFLVYEAMRALGM